MPTADQVMPRQEIRAVLLGLAKDLSAAESQAEMVAVVADLDRYVDRVVRAVRNGLSTEMKRLEASMEELRNEKQKITNEFQHLDQIVNQTMQGIARVLRALGQMRTGTGMAKPGM